MTEDGRTLDSSAEESQSGPLRESGLIAFSADDLSRGRELAAANRLFRELLGYELKRPVDLRGAGTGSGANQFFTLRVVDGQTVAAGAISFTEGSHKARLQAFAIAEHLGMQQHQEYGAATLSALEETAWQRGVNVVFVVPPKEGGATVNLLESNGYAFDDNDHMIKPLRAPIH